MTQTRQYLIGDLVNDTDKTKQYFIGYLVNDTDKTVSLRWFS